MKKYLIPEMEVELFDGRDLFDPATAGGGQSCPCETGYTPLPTCPTDVGFDPGTGCGDDTCGGDCLMVLGPLY